MEANEYDLIVIGSGPAGQKGAICAAKRRKKVAIIDRKKTIGGVCVHTGTIPSTRNLAMAWVLTLPVSMMLAGFLFWGFRNIF